MTKSEYFLTLHEFLVKAHEENAMETVRIIVHEMQKLPDDLQIFIVSSKIEERSYIDKKTATELWENNDNFKALYSINPMGECKTLKQR